MPEMVDVPAPEIVRRFPMEKEVVLATGKTLAVELVARK